MKKKNPQTTALVHDFTLKVMNSDCFLLDFDQLNKKSHFSSLESLSVTLVPSSGRV